MSLHSEDTGSVCQYNLLHSQHNVPAVGIINTDTELGEIPACMQCIKCCGKEHHTCQALITTIPES